MRSGTKIVVIGDTQSREQGRRIPRLTHEQQKFDDEIATVLNAEGLRTARLKSFSMAIDQRERQHENFTSEESTEVWFTDYGFGQLDGGVAVITIDPTFAQTVNLDEPYHVFLQAYGDADLYVTNRTSTQFEVHLREGDASVEFSYRLVGKRLGFEEDRLERAPWADSDRHLYPDGPPNGAAPVQEQQR